MQKWESLLLSHFYFKSSQVIVAAAVAHHHLVSSTCKAHGIAFLVPCFQDFLVDEVHGDGLALARLQGYPLESPQRLQWSCRVVLLPDVELYDFRTLSVAGIRDVDHQFVVFHTFRLDAERGIAQSVTKGKEWFAFEVSVGAIRHRVVHEVGQVADALVEGYRQLTAGIIHSRQDIGNSLAALFARIPCLQDGVGMLQLRHHGDGRA